MSSHTLKSRSKFLCLELISAIFSDTVFFHCLRTLSQSRRRISPAIRILCGFVRLVIYALMIRVFRLPQTFELATLKKPLFSSFLAITLGTLTNIFGLMLLSPAFRGIVYIVHPDILFNILKLVIKKIRTSNINNCYDFLCNVVILPLQEECFYRAFLAHRTVKWLNPNVSCALQAFWFASNHGSKLWMIRFWRSVVYCLVYFWSGGSVLTSLCVHSLNNLSAYLVEDSSLEKQYSCILCSCIISPKTFRYNCATCRYDVINLCHACFQRIGPHKRNHVMQKEFVNAPLSIKDTFQRNSAGCTAKLLHNAFVLYRDRPCIGVCSDNQEYQWLTFNDVLIRAKHIGSGLLSLHGIAERNLVGICGYNSMEWILSHFMTILFSFISVPLPNDIDQQERIISSTGLQIIITDRQCVEGIIKLQSKLKKSVQYIIVWGNKKEDNRFEQLAKNISHKTKILSFTDIEKIGCSHTVMKKYYPIKPKETLSIMFTSGSSGIPKGCLWTDSVFQQAARTKIDMQPLVVFDFQPPNHAFTRRLCLTCCCNGGRIGVHNGNQQNLLTNIQSLRPTLFGATPAFWNMLKIDFEQRLRKALKEDTKEENGKNKNKGHTDVRVNVLQIMQAENILGNRINVIITGGAPTPQKTKDFLIELFNVPVSDGYATTETGTIYTNNEISPNVDVILRDVPELGYVSNGSEVSGEICVNSPSVISGYFNCPNFEKDCFYFKNGKKYFRTGDIGKWIKTEKGNKLIIIDRLKSCFKLSQGEFIAPEALEIIYEQHDMIQQCFITGDSTQSSVIAVIVPSSLFSKIVTSERSTQILEYLRSIGDDNHLKSWEIPQWIYLEQFPFSVTNGLLTLTSKKKRKELKKKYQSIIMEKKANKLNPIICVGFSKLPQLNRILTDVLSNHIEITPNILSSCGFAQLGGDSMAALQFRKRVKTDFGISLPIIQLLQSDSMLLVENFILQEIDRKKENRKLSGYITNIHSINWKEELKLCKMFDDAVREAETNITKLPNMFSCPTFVSNINTNSTTPTTTTTPSPIVTVNRPTQLATTATATISNIFLTGATGYFGPFLLYSIFCKFPNSIIYCLVRAESKSAGLIRLRNTLLKYQCWSKGLEQQIRVLCGDVSRPYLGLNLQIWSYLARSVDVIFHNAAYVHGILPYSALKSSNVFGTLEVCKLAMICHPKHFIYVSSVNVLRPAENHPEELLEINSSTLNILKHLPGYAQTKFVSEILLTQAYRRGYNLHRYKSDYNDNDNTIIPVSTTTKISTIKAVNTNAIPNKQLSKTSTAMVSHPETQILGYMKSMSIIRPATIAMHSKTGCCNISDFTSGVICGLIHMGGYPKNEKIFPYSLLLTPVDYVSRALVELAAIQFQPEYEKKIGMKKDIQVYHLVTGRPTLWTDIISYIRNRGYLFEPLDESMWKKKLQSMNEKNPLFIFREQLLKGVGFAEVSHGIGPDTSLTRSYLQDIASKINYTGKNKTLFLDSLQCPKVTEKMFHLALDFLIIEGKIPEPSKNNQLLKSSVILSSQSSIGIMVKNPYYRMENWYSDLKDYTFASMMFPFTLDYAHMIKELKRSIAIKKLEWEHRNVSQTKSKKRSKVRHFNLKISNIGLSHTGSEKHSFAITNDMFSAKSSDIPLKIGTTYIKEVVEEWKDKKSDLFEKYEEFTRILDDAIRAINNTNNDQHNIAGVFIRLSSRSPKDAATKSAMFNIRLEQEIINFLSSKSQKITETDKFRIWRRASIRTLSIKTGKEAIALLAQSDRVSEDIHWYEAEGKFPMQVIVRQFVDLDSEWEFRAFITNNEMMAITQYYRVYVPELAACSNKISLLLREFWCNYIRDSIKVSNYTIDFTVLPDLSKIWVIEINYPPPVSSCILFEWENIVDRDIMHKGPFQIRVQSQSLVHPLNAVQKTIFHQCQTHVEKTILANKIW